VTEQSLYCYPGTDVLINIPDIREADRLERYEAVVTTARLAELIMRPVSGAFDAEHLKTIHRHVFRDVYPFAGEFRRENIAKGGFAFAPVRFLEQSLAETLAALAREKRLVGLSADAFAERAAHYLAELNVLHPFREGNGRTLREFVRQLAQNAGFGLDWSRERPEAVLEASIRSKTDLRDLTRVVRKCLTEAAD